MTRAMWGLVTILVLLCGCTGGRTQLSDGERIALRVHAASYAAVIDPAGKDEGTALVPRSECKHCKGTGKVKSGDGISTVACSHCYDDSEKPKDDPHADPGSLDEQKALDAQTSLDDRLALVSIDDPHASESPAPEGGFELPLPFPTSPADAAIDDFLSRQGPASFLLFIPSHADRSAETKAAVITAADMVNSHWPAAVVSVEAWPELADRLCVEKSPVFVALRNGREVAKVDALADSSVEGTKSVMWNLIGQGWPETFGERSVQELKSLSAAIERKAAQAKAAELRSALPAGVIADYRGREITVEALRSDLAVYRATPHRKVAMLPGSDVGVHLTTEHGWPASVVTQLSPADREALHHASHDGSIVANSQPGQTVLPNTVRRSQAVQNCPNGNCYRFPVGTIFRSGRW